MAEQVDGQQQDITPPESPSDDHVELLVRRVLSREAEGHREFLQEQLKLITRAIAVISAVALGVFLWLFGKSFSDMKEVMADTVNARLTEFQIDENLRGRLNTMVNQAIESPQVAAEIQIRIKAETDRITGEVIGVQVQEAVDELLPKIVEEGTSAQVNSPSPEQVAEALFNTYRDQLRGDPGPPGPQGPVGRPGLDGAQGAGGSVLDLSGFVRESELPDFSRLAAIPLGAVLPFDLPDGCPIGWSFHLPSGGRFIVGAGPHSNRSDNGQPLATYRFRSSGGAETHTLTWDEMPTHDHGGETGEATGADIWVNLATESRFTASKGPDIGLDPQNSHKHPIAEAGRDNAHNNMPPYIALYFCKKEAG